MKVNNVSFFHQIGSGAKARSHNKRKLRIQKSHRKTIESGIDSGGQGKMFEIETTGWVYFHNNPSSSELLNTAIETRFEEDFDELLLIIKEVELMYTTDDLQCFSDIYSTERNQVSINTVPAYLNEPMSPTHLERSKARRDLAYLLYTISAMLAVVLIIYALYVIWKVPSAPTYDPNFRRPSVASIERDKSRYFSNFDQEIHMFRSKSETLSDDEGYDDGPKEKDEMEKQSSTNSENVFVSTSNETLKRPTIHDSDTKDTISSKPSIDSSIQSKSRSCEQGSDNEKKVEDIDIDIDIDDNKASLDDSMKSIEMTSTISSYNDLTRSSGDEIIEMMNKRSFKSSSSHSTADTKSINESTKSYGSSANSDEVDSDSDQDIEASLEASVLSKKQSGKRKNLRERLNHIDEQNKRTSRIDIQGPNEEDSFTIPLEELIRASACCSKFDLLKSGRNKKSLAMQDSMQEESLPWNHSTSDGELSAVAKLHEGSISSSSNQSREKAPAVDESLRATAKMSNSSSRIIEQNLSHLFSDHSSGSLSSSSELPWYDSILKLSYKWNPNSDNGTASKLTVTDSYDDKSLPDLKNQSTQKNTKYFQIPFSSSIESSKVQTMSEVDITSTSATTHANMPTASKQIIGSDDGFMDMTADERRRYRDSLDELFDNRFQMDVKKLERPGLFRDFSRNITTEEREEETRKKLQNLRRRFVE